MVSKNFNISRKTNNIVYNVRKEAVSKRTCLDTASFLSLTFYNQDAPMITSKMKSTTNNAKPPPYPYFSDMNIPPFHILLHI